MTTEPSSPFRRRFDTTIEPPGGLDGVARRGVCRAYSPTPVSLELIHQLCAVALSSPTKSDLQQRDILIVQDPDLRNKLNALFPDMPWIAEAPAFLVFLANNRRQRQLHAWRGHPFVNDHIDAVLNAAVDAGIALQAFIAATEHCGLGCCPISAIRNHAATVHEWLNLPNHVFPLAGLTLGHPARAPRISPRLPLDATVHLDRFDETDVRDQIDAYDVRRAAVQPFGTQRNTERFGTCDPYTWSEDKARQYADPERQDFGTYLRSIGFTLT